MSEAETALQVLVDVCRRCELERQDDRPSEEEYQAALAGAEAVLLSLQGVAGAN